MTPEIKEVPAAAQAEMKRLFNEAQDAYNNYLTKREAAVEFIRATRRELGIQDNEMWDISNDGSQFIKVDIEEEMKNFRTDIEEQTNTVEPPVGADA